MPGTAQGSWCTSISLTGITLEREVVVSRVGFLHKTQTMDTSVAGAYVKFGEKLFDILKKSFM